LFEGENVLSNKNNLEWNIYYILSNKNNLEWNIDYYKSYLSSKIYNFVNFTILVHKDYMSNNTI